MRKKKILLLVIVLVFCLVCFMSGKSFESDDVVEETNSLKHFSNFNSLSMMLETDAGSGEYVMQAQTSWPTDGYVFNSSLSKCENGSTLSWDEESNTVVMGGKTSDKCYVYFDKVNTLTNWVISEYNNQMVGSETIYLHDENLENGAGDNSYRYAGSSELVNNYVCFGSDATTCPNDNLYRIIGVFNNQVKLIKWDYATSSLLGVDGDYSTTCTSGTYCGGTYGTSKGTNTEDEIALYNWNKTNYSASSSATGYYNDWSYSELNKTNLNINYIKNIGSDWAAKIDKHIWIVGGNDNIDNGETLNQTTAKNVYINEITNPLSDVTITYEDEIGLMYVSDYGYAASPDAWTVSLNKYNSYISNNWLYMGLWEWTITRTSSYSYFAYATHYAGYMAYSNVDSGAFAVRPVFYLKSDVQVSGGNGTKSNPILLS